MRQGGFGAVQGTLVGILTAFFLASSSCAPAQRNRTQSPADTPMARAHSTSFDEDVAFLRAHGDVELLQSPGGGRVAVSPGYQARVMTSAVAPDGRSLGFVHRAFITAGRTGTAFDNYGGEDRFWLGPEGGQFGLYFPPGGHFTFDAWQTPHEMQEGKWAMTARTVNEITFARSMRVVNVSGAAFSVDVERTVRLLTADDVSSHLGVSVPDGLASIAFETVNRITNAGDEPWTEDRGLLSVWILGMFAPAPDARIIVPFDPTAGGPVVNDRYFGKVPEDRLRVHASEGVLVLSADGGFRSKIGISAARARHVAGSYSQGANLLTIVQYDASPAPHGYVNSMWETQKEPYGGDVLNAYNDGPTAPGKPSLGGFYELESSSPAAALAPHGSIVHTHRTFHFVGSRAVLDPIARHVLGVSLDDVTR